MGRLSWRPIIVIASLLLALLLGRSLLGGGPDGRDAWDDVQAAGIVRVGMDGSYPPFEWIDEHDQFRGLDVALAQAMGQRWNVEVQFVNVHFDGLYEALVARKIDMIASALPFDELLTRDVRYSSAYLTGGQVIVGPVGSGALLVEDDLQGRQVAVEMGAEGHALLNRLNNHRGLGISVLALPDLAQAADAVREGRVDVLVCDRIDALALTADAALAIVGTSLTVDPYVIAVRMDSPRMAAEVQRALDAFAQDGTLATLERQWLVP